MRILILGGTVFLGRHIAQAALERGHEVTLFTRGLHGAELFAGEVERLRGDRSKDLGALRGRSWEAAVDTSAYTAAAARAAGAALTDAVEHYGFVSSGNAYVDWPREPIDEASPTWTEGEDYGAQKALGERALQELLPGRVALLRAGLIVGPHDNVWRLPWWVQRVARGGEVLAPGRPDRPLQLVDARDLAAFGLDLAEQRVAGAFNCTGPLGQVTMGELLETIRDATRSDATFTWVPDDELAVTGIEAWTEMPLWVPEEGNAGVFAMAADRAQTAGLRSRPVAETVADVAAWLAAGGEPVDWRTEVRATGLDPRRERQVLAAHRAMG
jgi:2'-hydroxyisoflavone reductase